MADDYDPQDDAVKSYYAAIEAKRARGDAAIRKEVQIGDCRLILGDCLEVLPTLGRFDAVVTDPPYLMGSASTRQSKGFTSRIGDWSNASHWYAAWLRACWDALEVSSGSMWICGNWRTLPVLTIAADSFGARISSTIVWDKEWIGVGPNNGLRQRYELMFQFGKGSFAVTDRSEPDIWPVKWASQRPSGHESEKPVGLMQRAIKNANSPRIIDPFMGSGTTGVAAVLEKRRFVGIEVEPAYFDIACERIRKAYAQPDMFIERPAEPKQESLFNGEAA
jgi:DNA modification methylase